MLLAINKNMFLNDSSTPVFQQSNDLCLLRLMVLGPSFEWSEFKEFVETQTDGLVSNIQLGSHSTVDEFRASSWQDWARPIYEEYEKLVKYV